MRKEKTLITSLMCDQPVSWACLIESGWRFAKLVVVNRLGRTFVDLLNSLKCWSLEWLHLPPSVHFCILRRLEGK